MMGTLNLREKMIYCVKANGQEVGSSHSMFEILQAAMFPDGEIAKRTNFKGQMIFK